MKTTDNQRQTHLVPSLTVHAFVKEAVIVSPHSPNEQRWAWVALSEDGIGVFRDKGRSAVVNELTQQLAQHHNESELPTHWRFCDQLPHTSQAEIDKFALPQQYEQQLKQQCLARQLDPIWQTETACENGQILHGKVPLDLDYFSGHFANFPLVPGVVELQWVVEQIHRYFGKEMEIARVDNLKFQKFLRPNDEIELTLKWDSTKNRMGFQLKTSNEMCASGLILLKTP